MRINILWEDEDIIVAEKPAGVATQTGKGLEQDMVSYLHSYIKRKSRGQCDYIGVVHRLDQPVRGVLVFAKTKPAAAALSRDVAKHQMNKYYYALLSSSPPEMKGVLVHTLLHNKKSQKAEICEEDNPEGKRCELSYEVIEDGITPVGNAAADGNKAAPLKERIFPGKSGVLVRIQLKTGRFHQIRAQFSSIGCPLMGDIKYGCSPDDNTKSICLCAYCLEFKHPTNGKMQHFSLY